MNISEEHATLPWSKSHDSEGHRINLRHLETLKTFGSVSLSHTCTHIHTHTYMECNEQCRQTLDTSPHSKTRRNVHIDMCLETFHLWVIAETILSWPISRAVRNVLSNTYHDRWIGRGGLSAWPPRPLDLNPMGFYLWRCLKTPVLMQLLLTIRGTSPSHCGCLSDCPQLRRHLWTGGHGQDIFRGGRVGANEPKNMLITLRLRPFLRVTLEL
jgi:hypothetical protein